MGLFSGAKTRILILGRDITGDVNKITAKLNDGLVDYACGGAVGYSQLPTLSKDEIDIDGLYDDTSKAVLETLMYAPAFINTAFPTMVIFGPYTGGEAGLACGWMKLDKLEYISKVEDLNRMKAHLIAHAYPLEPCDILEQGDTARVATAAGSTIVAIAGSTPGAAGYAQVLAMPYGGSAVLKIQYCSTFGGTYGDLITLGTFTTVGAVRVVVASTSAGYVKAQWTLSGGSPSDSATFAIGFHEL